LSRGPLDRRIDEILFTSLRERLSPDDLSALTAEGAKLGAEAAVEMALAPNWISR
jgi:hypothetical protein